MGRKLAAVPLWGAGFPSNKLVWAEVYMPTKWHLDPSCHFAPTDQRTWGKNWGGGCAPLGEELSPHLTMLSGLRSTPLPRGILIQRAVWPQQT